MTSYIFSVLVLPQCGSKVSSAHSELATTSTSILSYLLNPTPRVVSISEDLLSRQSKDESMVVVLC